VSFEEVMLLDNLPEVTENIASVPDFLTIFLRVIYDPITLIIFVLSLIIIWFILDKLKWIGAVVAAILIVLFVVLPVIYDLFLVF